MTGNYIALYVHLIWTTKYREPVLHKTVRYQLFTHIKAVGATKNIDIRIINGVDDHVHCLLALKATQTVSAVAQAIKGESSRWINEEKLTDGLFVWQDGYGAISVSPQHIPKVTRYIFNQEEHHQQKSLADELQIFALHTD